MRQPRPPPHVTLHAGAVDGRAVGKPQRTLSANGTIAKIALSCTESAIIEGSKFLPNQDPRDVSQISTHRFSFAL